MHVGKDKGQKKTNPTLLELLLRLEGDFRRILEPLRVTPSQAGVILFLRRHAEARVMDVAAALHVKSPTVSEVVKDLERRRWVTRRRSGTDTRVVHLSLSRQGKALALHIEPLVRQVKATLAKQDRRALGMIPKGRRA